MDATSKKKKAFQLLNSKPSNKRQRGLTPMKGVKMEVRGTEWDVFVFGGCLGLAGRRIAGGGRWVGFGIE
jgi:hypothetical protein